MLRCQFEWRFTPSEASRNEILIWFWFCSASLFWLQFQNLYFQFVFCPSIFNWLSCVCLKNFCEKIRRTGGAFINYHISMHGENFGDEQNKKRGGHFKEGWLTIIVDLDCRVFFNFLITVINCLKIVFKQFLTGWLSWCKKEIIEFSKKQTWRMPQGTPRLLKSSNYSD